MDSPCINVGLRAKALWLVLVFHFMTLRHDCFQLYIVRYAVLIVYKAET